VAACHALRMPAHCHGRRPLRLQRLVGAIGIKHTPRPGTRLALTVGTAEAAQGCRRRGTSLAAATIAAEAAGSSSSGKQWRLCRAWLVGHQAVERGVQRAGSSRGGRWCIGRQLRRLTARGSQSPSRQRSWHIWAGDRVSCSNNAEVGARDWPGVAAPMVLLRQISEFCQWKAASQLQAVAQHGS
jgi:hypothetical protein